MNIIPGYTLTAAGNRHLPSFWLWECTSKHIVTYLVIAAISHTLNASFIQTMILNIKRITQENLTTQCLVYLLMQLSLGFLDKIKYKNNSCVPWHFKPDADLYKKDAEAESRNLNEAEKTSMESEAVSSPGQMDAE